MKAPAKFEKRTHFRGTARPGRRVGLGFRLADSDSEQLIRATTRNIGVGGAFIVYENPLPIGTELHLEIDVPTTRQVITLRAEVRWLVPPGEQGDATGMGVQFRDVSVDALLLLNEYFASLTGQDDEG